MKNKKICPYCNVSIHELDDTIFVFFPDDDERVEFCRDCGTEIDDVFPEFIQSYFNSSELYDGNVFNETQDLVDLLGKQNLKAKLEIVVTYGDQFEMPGAVTKAETFLSVIDSTDSL